MKKICLIFMSIIILSCAKPKPFFMFDKVEHYQVNEKNERKKLPQINQTEKIIVDREFRKILMNYDYPISVKDFTFLQNLIKLYPKSKNIDTALLPELSEIFSEHKKGEALEYKCIPYFRDIFIFKNKSKITGIVKICFHCNQHYIVGANFDTKNFGANREFEKLTKLIKQ